ncbi:unnamed protein product [Lampetra fluviatilis]
MRRRLPHASLAINEELGNSTSAESLFAGLTIKKKRIPSTEVTERPQLQTILAALSRDQLVSLIGSFLERHPDREGEQGKILLQSQFHEAMLDYSLLACSTVAALPDWDNVAHNAVKQRCFRTLTMQCMSALSKSTYDREGYTRLRKRFEIVCTINSELQPCLLEVERKLSQL